MSEPLTRRQAEVMRFVRGYVESHGYAPTLKEIAAELGLSSLATVHVHLRKCQEKGHLKKRNGKSRWIVPATTDVPPELLTLAYRVLGRFGDTDPLGVAASEVIAKVEGRS